MRSRVGQNGLRTFPQTRLQTTRPTRRDRQRQFLHLELEQEQIHVRFGVRLSQYHQVVAFGIQLVRKQLQFLGRCLGPKLVTEVCNIYIWSHDLGCLPDAAPVMMADPVSGRVMVLALTLIANTALCKNEGS